jgi:hypothetical protein
MNLNDFKPRFFYILKNRNLDIGQGFRSNKFDLKFGIFKIDSKVQFKVYRNSMKVI